MSSRINDPERMKQLIDFEGLEVDDSIYPTDLDGLLEYKDSEYIIFEIKYGSADIPYSQRIAIQHMVDDFTTAGKQAIALICEHTVKNPDVPVVAARCKVREVYYGDEKIWRAPKNNLTVREAVDYFQKHSKLVREGQSGGS
ncbi:MAG: hypothetical protein KBS82_05225 [Oscillospiraceae bacterium]|nr:hypothetical protein [Candidatus Limimonas egerieequi]